MPRYLTFLESKFDALLKPYAPDEMPDTWTKNPNGSYDVDGDVDLSDQKLTKLPYKFNKVSGYFDCRNNNNLTSLAGAPKEVGGNFYCYRNNLTSLAGAPKEVGGDFNCNDNNLTSLVGAPKEVGGYFDCDNNNLTSLAGAPQKVGSNFDCEGNTKKFTKEDVKKVCKVKGKIIV
jgi:hypothetical protein